jgi:hypothetical protein
MKKHHLARKLKNRDYRLLADSLTVGATVSNHQPSKHQGSKRKKRKRK